jgi:EmrB/QacA subfamily drug resistance transporter
VSGPRDARLLSPAMLGIASGAILVPLNSTMLAVALPSIMDQFKVDAVTVSSLVTLYLGAVTIALLASGSLGDRYGQRPVFLIGVTAFAISSLIAVVAPSFEVLAASRVLQAISGALVSTTSVALVRALSPAERRGAAFGLFDMLVSTSAAIGPFIGGLLVGAFGWQSLFVLAVPVAIFAAVVVGAVVPSDTGRHPARPGVRTPGIDVPGLGLLAAMLIALLVAIRGIGSGVTGDAGAISIVAAVAVIPLLAIFIRYELRADRPAVDPRLFASRPFSAAVLGVLGATVILHATFILVPLLVERLLGGSAETAGLVLLGISGLGAVAAPFGGRLSDRRGRRLPVVAGAICATIGLIGLWLVAAETTALVIGVLLGVVGFGMGFSGSPRQAAALETVSGERVGRAAGTYYTGRYLGGVLGASLAGAVLGTTVTASGVTLGFGLLVLVGAGIVVVSFGLPGRIRADVRGSVVPAPADPAG